LNTRSYTPRANDLRDYQWEAVLACNPDGETFRSGVVHMECGTGKTWVASELIRRAGSCGIVVAQHAVSVTQFVTHLQTTLGLRATDLLQTDKVVNYDAYDVVVTTYSRVVRLVSAVDEHRLHIQDGSYAPSYSAADRFLMHHMCHPFGLLVLDEVHTVVADKFQCVCRLRAHAVVGFSGSLVREDDRIVSLDALVGPTLFSYGNADRVHHVHVRRVTVDDPRVLQATSRTAIHQTVRALNPRKVEELLRILETHSDRRVIVFSDTVQPTKVLHDTVLRGRSLLLNGSVTSREMRDEIIEVFSESAPGSLVLLCTKVCDVSVDFPVGCVVVQFHLTSGSRQQEVQRCGRGTRGTDGALVYHVVNEETEEERFSERRIDHLNEEMWGTVEVDRRVADTAPTPTSIIPLDALLRIKIANGSTHPNKRPKRHHGAPPLRRQP
jgi:DNA excision repair protein ERCC-3